jgi:hypothetical protein
MIKKVLMWLGIAFVVFFVINDPNGAADVAIAIGHGIAKVFRSTVTFVVRVVTSLA